MTQTADGKRTDIGLDGDVSEALVRTRRFFTRGEVSADLRTLHQKGGRSADDFYREARRSPGTPTHRPGCATPTSGAYWCRCSALPRHSTTGTRSLRGRTSWTTPRAQQYKSARGRGGVSIWFRGIFRFDLHPDLMGAAPIGFQIHGLVAMALFALWPFTRLVHVFSAPVGYLTRPYIVYRSREDQLGSQPTRRGWDRIDS